MVERFKVGIGSESQHLLYNFFATHSKKATINNKVIYMIQPLHLLILVYCFVTFSKHLIFTYLKSNYGFLAPNKNVPSILTFYHVIKNPLWDSFIVCTICSLLGVVLSISINYDGFRWEWDGHEKKKI
jgi:hypothetical protein